MRTVAVGLLVLAASVVGCGASDVEEVASGGSNPGQAASTVSSMTSTTSVSVDTGTSDVSDFSCNNERFLDGDFDGDGTLDRAYYDESPPSLVVCTADRDHVLAVGALEILVISDVDSDGRDELLAGATTAWGRGVELVALVDGELDFVVGPTGEPLTLWHGLPPGRVLASGCGSFTPSGGPEIAIVEGTVDDASVVTWERTIYRVDGHQVVKVSVETGSLDTSDSPDPLSDAALQTLVGEPC